MIRPLVYIVILNYNGYVDTIECVKSLREIENVVPKIVIVDNKSTDNSLYYLNKECNDCIIIENKENTGFAGGNNIGINYALEKNADYILILNNDTIVDSEFLVELLNGMKDTSVGVTSPKVYFYGTNIINSFGARKGSLEDVRNYAENELDSEKFDEDRYVSHVMGCCMLVKSEVFKEVGTFDERFFMYLEESDLCERIIKKYKIKVLHKAKIQHKCGASTKSATEEINYFARYYTRRNFLLFLDKNSNKLQGFLIKSIILFKDLLYCIKFIKDKKYRMVIGEAWKDYIKKSFYKSDKIQRLLRDSK